MPIENPNAAYNLFVDKVQRVRDCYEGSDAIKSAGKKYLPELSEQTVKEYDAYKMRALFLPVVAPSVADFVGSVMRIDPVIESQLDVEDINSKGRSLSLLAATFIKELLLAGRVGGLVDFKEDKPAMLLYNHESIINWTERYIILKQSFDKVDPEDKYNIIQEDEILELTFNDDGLYIQNRYRSNGKKFELFDSIIPTMRGVGLTYIPFACANTVELSFQPMNPPFLSVADINLDHYRLSADLKHGLHFTALPTTFLFGDYNDEDGLPITIRVGAGSANHIPDQDAKAELLEFTGAGLGAISDNMDSNVIAMSATGARLLKSQKGGVESAETAKIRASSDSASMSSIANVVDQLVEKLLMWANVWAGFSDKVSFTLNRDFIDQSIAAPDIKVLLESFMAGAMSLDTFLYNLKKGEKLPKDHTAEDEKALIINGEFGLDA